MGLFSGVKNLFKGVAKGIGSVFKGVAKVVKSAVKVVTKTFGKIFKSPIGSILGSIALSFAIPYAGSWLASNWGTFSTWAASIQNPLLGPVMRSVAKVGTAVGKVYGVVERGFNTLTEGIKRGFSKLASPLTEGWNAVSEGISNLFGTASNIPTKELGNITGEQLIDATSKMYMQLPGSYAQQAPAFNLGTTEFAKGNLGQLALDTGTSLGNLSRAADGTFTMPGLADKAYQGVQESILSGNYEHMNLPNNPFGLQGYDQTLGNYAPGAMNIPATTSTGSLDWKKALSGLMSGLGGSPVEAATSAGESNLLDKLKYGLTGVSGEGSSVWDVPYLPEQYKQLLMQQAEMGRQYIKGLGQRATEFNAYG